MNGFTKLTIPVFKGLKVSFGSKVVWSVSSKSGSCRFSGIIHGFDSVISEASTAQAKVSKTYSIFGD